MLLEPFYLFQCLIKPLVGKTAHLLLQIATTTILSKMLLTTSNKTSYFKLENTFLFTY